jgi:hypothetical protein
MVRRMSMGKGLRVMEIFKKATLLATVLSPFGAYASEVIGLRSCEQISRTAARVQEAQAGQLVDFVFNSKSALLYPIVSIEWRDAQGAVYRQEQKLDEIRGGQNFFTTSIPDSFQAASLKILINDQHCYQTALKVNATVIAKAEPEDASSLFFSVRPKVSPMSMLLMSLLISLGLLALVPQRKTYLLKRKLALPE